MEKEIKLNKAGFIKFFSQIQIQWVGKILSDRNQRGRTSLGAKDWTRLENCKKGQLPNFIIIIMKERPSEQLTDAIADLLMSSPKVAGQ